MRRSTPGASRPLMLLAAFVATSLVGGALFAGLFIPAVGATGAMTRSSVDYFNSLPSELSRPPLAEQSTMYASDGKTVIARFYDENRITVPLSRIAPVMRRAIMAIEDSRFYDHGGIDTKGVLRAAINNFSGGNTQGASTLTQQYIKNYNVEKCMAAGDRQCALDAVKKDTARKLQEMRTAIALEKQLTKDQILEGYLNIALFGDNTYGVEAAAQYYFNTPASKLSLVQAATLAGLVQSPEPYNPFRHPKEATTRRNEVLTRMHELKMISDKAYQAALTAPLKTQRHVTRNGCVTAGNMAFFCDYVIRTMETDPAYAYLGKTKTERSTSIKRGGYKIVTTLDAKLQRTESKKVVSNVPVKDPSKVAAAAVTVEPGTGKVLAMAQNRVYSSATGRGNTMLNYTVDKELGGSSGFATGSSFKPYTLATWLSKGKSLYDTVDASDRPNGRPFSDFTACGSRLRGTKPYTYSNAARGEGRSGMTVLEGTTRSVNTAFVQMESKLDICDIVKVASNLGVHLAAPVKDCGNDTASTVLPTCQPSLTLGPKSISPLTMASAYAAFAADGKYCAPHPVLSLIDRAGKKQKVAEQSCKQAISSDVAHGVTYALKTVLRNGTAAGKGISGHPSAGKTGTSDQSANTWFVGYTRYFSTAVWVADPNTYPDHQDTSGQRPLRNITINGRPWGTVYGGNIAASIWHDVMTNASKGKPATDWPDPPSRTLRGHGKRVPSVAGLSLPAAFARLAGSGFAPVVGGTVPGSTPTGTVASTSPSSGSQVASGSVVQINLSDGSRGGGGGGNGGGLPGRDRGRIGGLGGGQLGFPPVPRG